MDRDFKVRDEGIDPWEDELLEDQELVVFLNRLAIASTQDRSAEHPLAEIIAGQKQVSVSAVGGRLFYSDLNRVNVQNLNVLAEEVVGFLTDRITPGEHERDPKHLEDLSTGSSFSDGRGSLRLLRFGAMLFLGIILAFCGLRIYQSVSYQPRLVGQPSFVQGMANERTFLDRYSGFFLDAPKDAGQLLEIGEDGCFRLYLIWRRSSGNGFTLEPVVDLPLALGTSDGRDVALGGEIYLVVPKDENLVTLFGQDYVRYDRVGDKLSLWPKRSR